MKETFRKRPVRITLYLLGLLVMLFFLIQWLIRNHTQDLIEGIISQETKGKVQLDIGKLKFSFYPQTQIELLNTRLDVMDSAGQLPSYSVRFKYLGLRLQSLRSFLFDRQMLVDYFVAQNPEISIYPHVKKEKKQGNALVHVELGNIYLAMQRIAQNMRVKKFGIFDGKLHIASPRPDDFPVDLTDIDFLVDEFVMASAEDGDTSNALTVNKLKLRTGRQDITFPDGDYRMKYASLEISSADNSVRIDSFFISGKNQDTAYGSLEAGFRNLRLVNIDFKTLYEQDLLKVDSVYCQDPHVQLNLDLTARRINQRKRDTVRIVGTRGIRADPSTINRAVGQDIRLEKRIADLLGKLDIGYLGLINSDINVNTKNGNKYTPFSTKGNNFEAAGIRINSENTNPIEIDNLVFAIKNYKASTADSLYDFYFDSVAYRTGSLTLKNFQLEPSDKNRHADKKFVSIPDFELRELSLSELFSNKRFKAKELVLKNSRTINYYIPRSKSMKAPQPIMKIVAEISKTIDLERVRLENAYLLNESVTNSEQRIIVTGIYSDISANEMLKAPSYEIMGYSVGYLRFDSMHMQNGSIDIRMSEGEILGKEQKIRAGQLIFRDNRNRTHIQVRDAVIRNYHFDDDFERITVDSIHWKTAVVTFEHDNKDKKPEKSTDNEGVSWVAGHIHAENTKLNYVSGDSISAEMELNSLDIRNLAADENGNISLRDFVLSGNRLGYAAPGLQVGTGPFSIRESGSSSIRDIRIESMQSSDTLKANVPALRFIPQITETLKKKYPVFREIYLDNPVIFASMHAHHTEESKKPKRQLPVDIGKLVITQAQLDIRQQAARSLHARSARLDVTVDHIKKDIGRAAFSLGKTSLETPLFDLRVNDSVHLMMDDGKFALELDHVVIGRDEDSGSFNALLNHVDAKDLSLLMRSRKGKEPLELNRFDIGGVNLQIDSLDKAHVIRQLKANPSLFVRNIDLRKTTANSELFAYGIGYRNGGRIVSVDSFRYRPLIDRDSFSRTLEWQKVYLDGASTGKITIYDFDIERIVTDSSYQIRAIDIQQPDVSIYKDKRVPFNFGTIKPLPTDMLKQVQARIHVDSVRLHDARITYEEFNDKTNRLGSVHFKNMRALIRGIDTYRHGPKDSLYMLTYAVMEDSIRLRLHVDESYADSLGAFYMSVRIAPFNLPVLNSMLEPLASARVVSGNLDTLQMRAVGREYIAHGKMKLYYRNLKVNILDKSNQERKTIGTRLANFVANLLIDKKNVKKTGSVFTERVRERGFLHYWIRIVLSGALTNTGIRKNTKAEKKYKKALRKDHVPDIPDVDL